MSEHFAPEPFAPRDHAAAAERQADRRRLRTLGIGAAVVALAVAAVGITTRLATTHRLAEDARASETPTVNFILPDAKAAKSNLVLPGQVQAWNSAAIYARTNGYLRRWLADIGDRVREGQPLAELDAPDLDQQLAQARADYQTTVAQQALAGTTAKRWATLLKADAVSQQEADEKAGDLKAKTAVANASLANVRRLQALKSFTLLRAPFAGTVTSRSAQIGALVVSNTTSAQPLFTISDVHRIRIYVRVPQASIGQLHPGMTAELTLPEYPGRTFPATLVRAAGAVDNASGAMLVELQSDNAGGALKPGAYAQVNFPIGGAAGAVRIPSSALIFSGNGTSVAVVGNDGRVTMKPVTIARDLGKQLEISSGIKPGDRVIDSPPDAIENGDKVNAVPEPKAADAKG